MSLIAYNIAMVHKNCVNVNVNQNANNPHLSRKKSNVGNNKTNITAIVRVIIFSRVVKPSIFLNVSIMVCYIIKGILLWS